MLFVCVPRYLWIERCISSHYISLGVQAAWITLLTFQTSIEPRFDASARAAPGPAPVAILADWKDLVEGCQTDHIVHMKVLGGRLDKTFSEFPEFFQTYLDAFSTTGLMSGAHKATEYECEVRNRSLR